MLGRQKIGRTDEAQEETPPPTHEKERYRGPIYRIISLLLMIAASSITIFMLTLFTYFNKFASRFPFLSGISLIIDTLNFLYHFPRLLLKPIPLGIKIFFSAISLMAFILNAIPTVTSLLVTVFNVEALSVLLPYLSIFSAIALAIPTCLSLIGLLQVAHDYVYKPWMQTPETQLRLASKGIKSMALIVMTAVVIPLSLATGGVLITASLVNPFTAGPTVATLFSIMLVASLVIVTMKLVKVYAQRRLQEQEALVAAQKSQTPYEILHIDPLVLNELKKRERNGYLNSCYQNRENEIITSQLSEEIKQNHLKENYLAYELLKSSWAVDKYKTFKLIREGHHGKPIPPPEKTLKINYRLGKFRPFSWIHYLVQKEFASEKKKHKLDLAYTILTNSALYHYQKEVGNNIAETSASFNETQNQDSTPKILRYLFCEPKASNPQKTANTDYLINSGEKKFKPLKTISCLNLKKENDMDISRTIRHSI